uniref:Uncharacterized protein n=1 Tax=Chestnut teal chaphamaparvovirus TaxID=2759402 RepID=A0A7D7B3C1_9VIRU|nr:hypothetical protein [Chestnut teal chaphamaparvovirus]
MTSFGQQGCTVLAWANMSSPIYGPETLHEGLEEQQQKIIKEMLSDAAVLWGTRWGADFTWHEVNGTMYIYGIMRFTISNQTLERALGGLAQHIMFHRGGPNDSWEALVRYRNCLSKWSVPDTVTESTSGTEQQEKASAQFWGAKKTRR